MTTNCLAKLAAWTVSNSPSHHEGFHGLVLDPRFSKLRLWCELKECGHESECSTYDGPGYTVNEDLSVLLGEVIQELYWDDGDGVELTMLIGTRAKVQVGPEWHDMPWAEADTTLEAAAQAIYEHLEAERKAAPNA